MLKSKSLFLISSHPHHFSLFSVGGLSLGTNESTHRSVGVRVCRGCALLVSRPSGNLAWVVPGQRQHTRGPDRTAAQSSGLLRAGATRGRMIFETGGTEDKPV